METTKREEFENTRRKDLGEFYVPLPPIGEEKKAKTVKAKGLYINGDVAGLKFQEENINFYADYINRLKEKSKKKLDESNLYKTNKLEKVLGITKASEINAVVIDIKDADGYVTWASDLGIVKQIGANENICFFDYKSLLDYLKQNKIYTIARIAVFKDPVFADSKPEHVIQLKDGGIYLDNNGDPWMNPFDQYVWNYVIALSKEAALRGFDEIQYDYVRFPDRATYYNLITEFPGRNNRDKDEGIEEFLALARKELKPYNVHIAADVFGYVTHSWDDISSGIGQTWRMVANQVDYICPMIYPSHYGIGIYGYIIPDRHPYKITKLVLMEAIERNAAQREPGIIRPWFQGFSAPWVRFNLNYNAKAISEQMVAAWELGVEEYIIWNSRNDYDPMSFFYHDRINKTTLNNGVDIMNRTPKKAIKKFLDAHKKSKYSTLYLLTIIEDRKEDFDEFVEVIKKTNPILKSYTIKSISKNEDTGYLATVNVSYKLDWDFLKNMIVEYKIIEENRVFKVKAPKMNWKE